MRIYSIELSSRDWVQVKNACEEELHKHGYPKQGGSPIPSLLRAVEAIKDALRLDRYPDKEFSGKFVLRAGSELHRKAAEEAKRRGISLNEFVELALINDLGGDAL